mmetsp:Transcript_57142/g.107767  ORF Transcript_57142/g.107767 Transcript_57142/m.107767 type:complete len:263 (+) Transcript_57142:54-842(+)
MSFAADQDRTAFCLRESSSCFLATLWNFFLSLSIVCMALLCLWSTSACFFMKLGCLAPSRLFHVAAALCSSSSSFAALRPAVAALSAILASCSSSFFSFFSSSCRPFKSPFFFLFSSSLINFSSFFSNFLISSSCLFSFCKWPSSLAKNFRSSFITLFASAFPSLDKTTPFLIARRLDDCSCGAPALKAGGAGTAGDVWAAVEFAVWKMKMQATTAKAIKPPGRARPKSPVLCCDRSLGESEDFATSRGCIMSDSILNYRIG